jgi:hypothetical protein
MGSPALATSMPFTPEDEEVLPSVRLFALLTVLSEPPELPELQAQRAMMDKTRTTHTIPRRFIMLPPFE